MEDKYLNDDGQFEFKLTRAEYMRFISFFKDFTGLSLDKCFFDNDEDYFDLTIEIKNTDLPF